MPEPFFDDGQIGAAREKPRGMSVTQIMDSEMDSEICSFECWYPNVLAEPSAGNVAIAVHGSRLPRLVLAAGPAPGPVDSERGFAVKAPAVACIVAAESAVEITAAGIIWSGQSELFRIR